jgi:hypothetical protein
MVFVMQARGKPATGKADRAAAPGSDSVVSVSDAGPSTSFRLEFGNKPSTCFSRYSGPRSWFVHFVCHSEVAGRSGAAACGRSLDSGIGMPEGSDCTDQVILFVIGQRRVDGDAQDRSR